MHRQSGSVWLAIEYSQWQHALCFMLNAECFLSIRLTQVRTMYAPVFSLLSEVFAVPILAATALAVAVAAVSTDFSTLNSAEYI